MLSTGSFKTTDLMIYFPGQMRAIDPAAYLLSVCQIPVTLPSVSLNIANRPMFGTS